MKSKDEIFKLAEDVKKMISTKLRLIVENIKMASKENFTIKTKLNDQINEVFNSIKNIMEKIDNIDLRIDDLNKFI